MLVELEAVSLRRLSDNLERLLDPAFLDCVKTPRSSSRGALPLSACTAASLPPGAPSSSTDSRPLWTRSCGWSSLSSLPTLLAPGPAPQRRLTPAYPARHSPRAPDRLHRTPLTYICLFVKYTSLLEFLDRFAVAVDKKPWLELAKFIADSPRSRSCASTPPHPSLSRAP
jgi:hypothetical protein